MIGGLGSLTPYRPYFIAFAAVALVWTFYRHFGKRIRLARRGGLSAMLAEFKPRTVCDAHLYVGAALVAGVILLPTWTVSHYFNPQNPCAIRNPWPREILEELRESPRTPCAVSSPDAGANP